MKNKKILYLGISIIVILVFALFFITKNNNKILLIDTKQIDEKVNEKDFVFIYNGELNSEINSFIKDIKNNNRVVTYQIYLNKEEMQAMSTDDVTIEQDGYLVYVNKKLEGFISNELDDSKKMEYVKKYLYGYIPEEERYYQVLSTADEYIKKFNSKDYTIAVFGRTDCTWCTKYLSVVNDVAKKYDLSIYYFEKGDYDETEYQKVIDLDFTIPGECTQSGEDTSLARSFDKPLTVITKSGELVGCIKGYVTEDVLTNKLKEFKLVKDVK